MRRVIAVPHCNVDQRAAGTAEHGLSVDVEPAVFAAAHLGAKTTLFASELVRRAHFARGLTSRVSDAKASAAAGCYAATHLRVACRRACDTQESSPALDS